MSFRVPIPFRTTLKVSAMVAETDILNWDKSNLTVDASAGTDRGNKFKVSTYHMFSN